MYECKFHCVCPSVCVFTFFGVCFSVCAYRCLCQCFCFGVCVVACVGVCVSMSMCVSVRQCVCTCVCSTPPHSYTYIRRPIHVSGVLISLWVQLIRFLYVTNMSHTGKRLHAGYIQKLKLDL